MPIIDDTIRLAALNVSTLLLLMESACVSGIHAAFDGVSAPEIKLASDFHTVYRVKCWTTKRNYVATFQQVHYNELWQK